jgi:homopolymeric O-antigen transport system permease protein
MGLTAQFITLYKSRLVLNKLTYKEFTIRYKNSLLGFLWTFLNPFLMMMVYVVVFSHLLRIKVDNYPVYLLAALVPWTFTQSAISSASRSLVDNSSLLKKIFFPREIIPLAVIFSFTLSFLISLLLLFVIVIFFDVYPSFRLFLLPLAVFCQILFISGLSFVLSSFYIRYRDIKQILDVVFRFWFYLSPIVYPVDFVPETYLSLYRLNPMVGFTSFYRDIFLKTTLSDSFQVIYCSFLSVGLFVFGFWIFGKRKRHFADWV